MGTKGSVNRQRIVEAADHLFYSRGYNQTSFSDISDETGIPRGNFYYYFKTKEDILAAVVDSRLSIFRQMLQECDRVSTDPGERLLAFAQMPVQNEQQILQYGCPIGTLSSELVKDQDHGISKARLTAVFDLLRDWCEARFKELGYTEQARDYALDLIAKMQGMSIIANVYNDAAFLHRTTNDIQQWIQQITSAQH
ncbi:MAG: TetR/AcrR family transcriptional regulator [Gammaproteobacteria bacterium]|nr:TetR/AcrR family transcriptional regulator [Gammaproteobacteria bacterium]